MLSELFTFYKEKKDNSYMLFGKQNNKEHADMFTTFRTQLKPQFRSIINHFLNKLQLKQNAQQIIKQNLSSFYIWKNQKQEVEVFYIDASLTSEIKYKNQISDETYKQFYEILLGLSNLNIQDVQQEIITTANFFKEIDQLYHNIAVVIQKEQKKGNTDQQFISLKILTRGSFILRPSGDLIKLPKISNDKYNFNHTYIYISTRIPFCNPNLGDLDQTVFRYTGSIDQQTFLPNGQGVLDCDETFQFQCKFVDGLATGKGCLDLKFQKQKFEGQFQNGLKHGESITSNPNQTITTGYYQNNMKQGIFINKIQNGSIVKEIYYKNDLTVKQKDECKFDEKTICTRYLVNHKDISINNHFFSGLTEEKWINQLLVDYYLRLLSDYYKTSSKAQIYLFNTSQSQDLFTSQISLVDQKSLKVPQKHEQVINDFQKYNKIIFILNADQVHFLVLVYQNKSLYMLNSYATQNDQKILQAVGSIFPIQLNLQQIQVEQQQNTYDCSLYSIYNVMLQYKYYNLDVEKIDYRVSYKYIKKLRLHLKNIISNDYAHIILQQD
ncbi:unnamed protein product (macronuclear) [Paramecium tetraurelia]|uniref:Ubiquitin-like protease family profile domain-containing protein n=1 Tax=Paramecium tetraurelia TaxID=5888 RepID=A0D4W2_PARTE|nr:uncharacterized protein GSPATT00013526001 [Paramecium tetraurelia]CAK78079.1 unnamed protein product [Paramecium tetraurelia]|eukprot:XP_001445476.1 hypothetical protein (macronuclear) [Paramecium tetraurelia strain d4-2]